ncbi:hypothetical protein COU89_00115 [Candidatus Roizmanbacteria bacterium CG10_big_fil_rev_8_21_14_0_10_45_7]|uniref:Sugar transporter n=1 Tax=Candidatus Roizmanbacteria bacterium CG10_big_fil_rev_8_21_14_0_10_45_7 TaxID=1974854 RepID=A0A2M8KVR5_9BACT|nr:MAG: hypothetical protein COU89_00115 [Candidatus Roizmanbacteria bacterium CG10_big_fil_rev_8_21_14_0_10_45_7]
MLVLRHLHHRRRQKKSSHNFLDNIIYVIAFAGPVMTIPQIYDVWVAKQLSVNPITWGSYCVIAVVWLCYGLAHKVKPIIFSNTLGIITTGLVFLGATIYR